MTLLTLNLLQGCSDLSEQNKKTHNPEDRRVMFIFPGGIFDLVNLDTRKAEKAIQLCQSQNMGGKIQTRAQEDWDFVDCLKEQGYEVVITYERRN